MVPVKRGRPGTPETNRQMIILKQEGDEIISGASMKDVPNILWLEEIRKEDISSVGGKGASLGEMASIGLPVPPAFVVTAQTFRRFLVETGLDQKIFKVSENIDVENNAALEKAADNYKGPGDEGKDAGSDKGRHQGLGTKRWRQKT